MLARPLFGATNIQSIKIENDDYVGYKEFYFTEEEMAYFYSNPAEYGKDLYINEYINIYDKNSQERVDTLLWTGEEFRQLKYKSFISKQLGEVKPYRGDIYQAMVSDSLMNNKITMIKGPAGAGKSHLAIGYLFSLLDRGKIDKIIVFCNTVATKNAAKLGFYPGSRDEKLLDSQIGNFLSSKIGGKIAVEQLIDSEKLLLLPMSDIRGYDTSGMNAGIYITEAQNLDVELLKLALQRVGEDSIIILDGDTKSQVDLADYEGSNNGMRRVSKVFRGEDIYGEVELKQIHRSKIAEIANKM
jgi:predicted ribonuclease YlaK